MLSAFRPSGRDVVEFFNSTGWALYGHNADDRLSLGPLGRVEGGNRIVEGSHDADVCPQPTIPQPLDELTQLGAIGTTTKSIVRPSVGRASVGR